MQLLNVVRVPLEPTALRRRAAGAVGVIGLLVLPGSQPVTHGVAFLKSAQATGLPGTRNYYAGASAAALGAPSAPAAVVATGPKPFGFSTSAAFTASGIPEPAYKAYVNAAKELARTDPSCKISWTLIAGIGRVESNHGRYDGSTIRSDGLVTPPILGIRLDGSRPGTASVHDSDNGRYDGDPVYDRAVGPMQFLPGTWKTYGGGANPQNMNAAALATGRYLCAGGGSLATQPGRWAAVYRYNHSDSYVSLVLSIADSYASGHPATFPTRPAGTPPPDDSAPSATTPGPPPSLPPATNGKPAAGKGKPTPTPTSRPAITPTGSSTPPSGPAPTQPAADTPAPSTTTDDPAPTSDPTSDPSDPPTPTDSPVPTEG